MFRAISNVRLKYLDPIANAKRVIFFYKILFRQRIVVVINITERVSGKQLRDIAGVVRALVEVCVSCYVHYDLFGRPMALE